MKHALNGSLILFLEIHLIIFSVCENKYLFCALSGRDKKSPCKNFPLHPVEKRIFVAYE